MKNINIYIIFSVLMLVTSCGSHRTAVQQDTAQGSTFMPSNPVAALAASSPEWTDLTVPVRMELTQPMRVTASGTAKMINAQAVSVSVRVLGFEVASMYADSDSVFFLIRINKTAYAESLERFTAASGLNMSDIQALLLGKPFVPSLGQLAPGNIDQIFITESDGNNAYWSIQRTGTVPAQWNFSAYISPENSYMTSTAVSAGNNNGAQCVYSRQENTDAGIVAADNSLTARVLDHNISANITWNLGRAQWNGGITISKPAIPAAYSRISTEGLLRFLSQSVR